MIKLYTHYVESHRGYEWSRNVWFVKGWVGDYNTKGFSIRRNTNITANTKSNIIELSGIRQNLLGIRVGRREVTIDQHFKPETLINSLMLEICDKFLN